MLLIFFKYIMAYKTPPVTLSWILIFIFIRIPPPPSVQEAVMQVAFCWNEYLWFPRASHPYIVKLIVYFL
jgi:hypothetical protein